MSKPSFLLDLVILLGIPVLLLVGCASGGGLTPQSQADVTAVENFAYEAATFAQQLNTGFQTVAPSVEAILAMTHNQGDAATLQAAAGQSQTVSAAIGVIQSNLAAAIANNKGAAQVAAVNAALSPASVQTAVGVATGTNPSN